MKKKKKKNTTTSTKTKAANSDELVLAFRHRISPLRRGGEPTRWRHDEGEATSGSILVNAKSNILDLHIKRAAPYVLSPNVFLRVAFVIHSAGSNGKLF